MSRIVLGVTASRDGTTKRQIRGAFEDFKEKGLYPDYILFGGARGGDTIALIAAAKIFPKANLWVIVPRRLVDQPEEAVKAISNHADKVIEMEREDFPRASSYWARNDLLVSKSTHVVAFYGEKRAKVKDLHKGGTGGTALIASTSGKKLKRIFVDDYE